MGQAIAFALIASAALPIGAALGAWTEPPRQVTAALLAFASGALITAVAFELFEDAFHADEWRAGIAFAAGATVFIVVDSWLERRTARRGAVGGAIGFALLAGVTLDGVPENLALGVSLIEDGGAALLVAIFVSNLPEAVVGARKMRDARIAPGRIMAIWVAAAILLALAVVLGYRALEGVSGETLAWPLGFAGGAVLASLAATLMPEAFKEGGGPWIAYATALGFLVSFLISTA
jgi:ZIP family zinc transporter